MNGPGPSPPTKVDPAGPEHGRQGVSPAPPQKRPSPPPSRGLSRLQHTLGNRGVSRLIQAKLRVSDPEDPHEREADRVADAVMRSLDPSSVAAAGRFGSLTPRVQRMC